MKKFLSALCAACLLVCSLTFTAPSAKAAGDSLDIVLTNASGVVNDEITVEMNITQNPGMYAFWFFLYYDSDAFILKDVKVNEALKSEGDLYDTENAATSDSVKGLIAKRVINYFGSYGVDSAGKNLKILFFEGKSIYENTDYVGNVATFTFQIMGIADDGEFIRLCGAVFPAARSAVVGGDLFRKGAVALRIHGLAFQRDPFLLLHVPFAERQRNGGRVERRHFDFR